MSNIKIEMIRNNISTNDIAKTLNIHRNTASQKINGKLKLDIEELKKIRDIHFPNCTLDYLAT